MTTDTTIRRGMVRVWDSHLSGWRHIPATVAMQDHQLLSTLPQRDRARIEAAAHERTLTEARALVRSMLRRAAHGVLQAEDMLDLTGRPTLHTTMTVVHAADALGLTHALDLYRRETE